MRRSSPRRSMREGKRRFFHPADEGHTALSIMKSEPLAVLAAGLLILSCLVTGECLLCKRGDCRMGSVWVCSRITRSYLMSVGEYRLGGGLLLKHVFSGRDRHINTCYLTTICCVHRPSLTSGNFNSKTNVVSYFRFLTRCNIHVDGNSHRT